MHDAPPMANMSRDCHSRQLYNLSYRFVPGFLDWTFRPREGPFLFCDTSERSGNQKPRCTPQQRPQLRLMALSNPPSAGPQTLASRGRLAPAMPDRSPTAESGREQLAVTPSAR
jgi:hypothetical protein